MPLQRPPEVGHAVAPVLDWAGMMRAGLTGLRLRPAEFWALTPAELMLMLGIGQGPQPMARDRLEALIQAFPDSKIERTE